MVLICGSFIEQGLEQAIKTVLLKEAEERSLSSELFGGDKPGAINGFYGKIILGYSLGLYTKYFRDDLDRVRHIRNAFAHSKLELSFKTKEIADVSHFYCSDFFKESSEKAKRNLEDPRQSFLFMAFFAVLTFQLTQKDSAGVGHPEGYPDDRILP